VQATGVDSGCGGDSVFEWVVRQLRVFCTGIASCWAVLSGVLLWLVRAGHVAGLGLVN
jgi:hypothetical protein